MKPDIYLDIDGVLRGCYSPTEDIIAFVRFILDNFLGQIYWLTTHCVGGVNNTLPALKDAFPPELAEELFQKVKPANWHSLKTSGINFDHDFIWFDDNLFISEQYELDKKNLRYNAYVLNPRDSHSARNALQFLKHCPTGESAPLRRFLSAMLNDFELAKNELSSGRKESHYMWYMFPQFRGLGQSENSRYYAIRDELEAVEFLNHKILSIKLCELCAILLASNIPADAKKIFGDLDALKLQSCMTLFDYTYRNNKSDLADTGNDFSVFEQILNKFFEGKPDEKTLELIENF